MKDFFVTIGDVTASTDMIEEDVVRFSLGLDPKPQDKVDIQAKEDNSYYHEGDV